MRPFSGRHAVARAIAHLSLTMTIAAFVASSAAQAQHAGHHMKSGHGGHRAATSSDTASVADYKAAHERMMRAMDVPYTGDPDVDFRLHMIPHHAGAMDMARVAMRHAKNPFTRQLAEAIQYEQQREIAEMQGWLERRGVPVPSSGQPYFSWSNEFVRTDVRQGAGTRDELAGQAWAPGLGVTTR